MFFNSEAERMKHPQARLIPQDAWARFFRWKLSEELIALMEMPLEILQTQSYSASSNNNIKWIAIIFSHPHASPQDLIAIATQLHLTQEQIFIHAAATGRCDILEHLKTRISADQLQQLIAADDYKAFGYAGEHGHLDILQWLQAQAPNQIENIVKANNSYFALKMAVQNDHFDVVKWLQEQAPNQVKKVLTNSDSAPMAHDQIFGWAASHLDILKWLAEQVPEQIQKIITEFDYSNFASAAHRGDLDMLKWFKEQAPDHLQKMIAGNHFEAFRRAAQNNHLDVLKWLANEAPDQIQEMITASQSFGEAKINCNLGVINFLFSLSANCFADFECHDFDFYNDQYITPFIQHKLATLYQKQQAFAAAHPNTAFTMTDHNEVTLYFYIAKNLVRRCHDESDYDDVRLNSALRFLLNIPAIRALAHTAVSPQETPNELLRLAIKTGNVKAAIILLDIPEVAALAKQNNFYENEEAPSKALTLGAIENEKHDNINLRDLAQNHASHMSTLKFYSSSNLKNLLTTFHPFIIDDQPVKVPLCGFNKRIPLEESVKLKFSFLNKKYTPAKPSEPSKNDAEDKSSSFLDVENDSKEEEGSCSSSPSSPSSPPPFLLPFLVK